MGTPEESTPTAVDDHAPSAPATLPEPPPKAADPERRMDPPQLVRVVNLLPRPQHDISGRDPAKIAQYILLRAREGVQDIFAHEAYNIVHPSVYGSAYDEAWKTEAWARAIAEHQTGIPYTQPAYFYDGGQKAVAQAIAKQGRYPLAGQCQQSVTTALCMGGWDGGLYGDIGSGISSQLYCSRLGEGLTKDDLQQGSGPGKTGMCLAEWSDALWKRIGVGTCIFWSAPCPMTRNGETCGNGAHVPGCGEGSGHVAMVIRKHPTARQWQLWDTTTSFNDPITHPTAIRGARMLWESHWWSAIPATLQGGAWAFRGLGRIRGIGEKVVANLRPRGRARLILRNRNDGELLHRSAWISMEAESLPISWLLRSMRGVPFCEEIEATWCIDSPGETTKPALPMLDLTCDPSGFAQMSWMPDQGCHKRPLPAALWRVP